MMAQLQKVYDTCYTITKKRRIREKKYFKTNNLEFPPNSIKYQITDLEISKNTK